MQLEDKLIQYCLRIDTTKRIKQVLSPDLNWAYFFKQAGTRGLAPLVYSRLCEINGAKSLIPQDTWRKLESSYYTIASRNSLLCDKLNTILSSFNRAGIEIILLKGMALIHTIYPDLSLRPMYDIDILIHEKDFSLAEKKLRELGYNNSSCYPEDFHKDDMMVDLHWELINTTRIKSRRKCHNINMEDLWQSSIPIKIDGQYARILSCEFCLMVLCLHLGFHHGFSSMMGFVDIARCIEYYKEKIDWDKFIKKSFEFKISKPIYYALYYVKDILKQDIPDFVLDNLKPLHFNFLERKTLRLILAGESVENIRLFFTLSNMGNFLDKLIFLKEVSFLSPEVLQARYNLKSPRLIPKYYLIHFQHILLSVIELLKK